jgi:chromosome partitioning protein
MPAKVVGLISEKGGVGKTTACYHIGIGLAAYHQKRVLIVDADYQRGGISGRFFPDLIEDFAAGSAPGITLYHKYQQLYSASPRTPDVDVRKWNFGNSVALDVIAADPRLSTVSVDKLPSTNNIRQNNALLLEHLQMLDFVLARLKDNYDYVLIDSHPEVSDVLRSIIYASDFCVSPVKLDRQSSIGVATILGEISNVNADVEMIRSSVPGVDYQDTEFKGAIGMMAREYAQGLKQTEDAEYRRLRRLCGVFEAYVTEGDGLRQAAAQRYPVYYIPGANADKQADQFRALTREFMQRCL